MEWRARRKQGRNLALLPSLLGWPTSTDTGVLDLTSVGLSATDAHALCATAIPPLTRLTRLVLHEIGWVCRAQLGALARSASLLPPLLFIRMCDGSHSVNRPQLACNLCDESDMAGLKTIAGQG